MIFGWLVFITYLFYDLKYHEDMMLRHIISPGDPRELFLHIVIFSTLIGSHITAYLINERKKLLINKEKYACQLKVAAHEWKVTFDSMPYGVLLTDENCNILRANRYVEKLAGIPVASIINNKCYERVCRSSGPPVNCSIFNVYTSRKTETSERTLENDRIFRESITPLIDENGTVTSAVHVLIDITESKQKESQLTRSKNAFFNMLKDLDGTNKELRDIYESLIITFSNIIDAKSPWTKGHSIDATNYALLIAREMEIRQRDMETLRIASLLHDIGKIGTYDDILDKPGKLNKVEQDLIRLHPLKGEEILRPIKGLEKTLPIIRSHHEKFNGSGYPDGLRGDRIPLLARILCVADSYDAMMANRPYRLSRGRDYAISELKRCAGEQFDPHIVGTFLETLNEDHHLPIS
jgi:putative nucleotidyltransferase with HDIG domain/PAS domain S-box-containing protein